MVFTFLGMLVSGILSYAIKYNDLLSAFHVVFAFGFIFVSVLHLFNNRRTLGAYFSHPSLSPSLFAAAALTGLISAGVYFSVPPFRQIVDYGKSLRQRDELASKTEYVLTTKSKETGRDIRIDFREGPMYTQTLLKDMPKLGEDGTLASTPGLLPQIAVWLERPNGEYVETLYVSRKAATGSYKWGKKGFARRPESLPVWSHKRNIKSDDGLYMPGREHPLADVVTGATPLTSFTVKSKYKHDESLNIMIEANKSFDYNDYFNKQNLSNNAAYKKSPNGQPSVVYRGTLDLNKHNVILAELIGHGHMTGEDGLINPDLSKVTTAKDIFQGIIVTF
jgi:hypothetical protein